MWVMGDVVYRYLYGYHQRVATPTQGASYLPPCSFEDNVRSAVRLVEYVRKSVKCLFCGHDLNVTPREQQRGQRVLVVNPLSPSVSQHSTLRRVFAHVTHTPPSPSFFVDRRRERKKYVSRISTSGSSNLADGPAIVMSLNADKKHMRISHQAK